jgi:transposase
VRARLPQAVRCADAFHVVTWAMKALDEERRRGGCQGSVGTARALKNARWALWKNPDNLSDRQRAKLDWIAKTDSRLHRAYLLKEGLRFVFQVKGQAGKEALQRWLAWAARCQIPAFVALGRKIHAYRDVIDAALDSGLSNGLIESTNTKSGY